MDPHGHKPADCDVPPPGQTDALRIQVAAVVAQQAALDEEETRLAQRRTTLEHQECQLNTDLDDKRRELQSLQESAQAERAALEGQRLAYERHIEKITGDLSPAQREILEAEKQVQAERRRLSVVHQQLKQRWHRHWKKRQQQYFDRQRAQDQSEKALAERERQIQEAEEAVRDRRLRCNGEAVLARQHGKEQWAKLRQAQFRWKHRRGLERAALRFRAHEVEAAVRQLAHVRRQLEHDQRTWRTQRCALDVELDGVNTRVENQRQIMNQQEARLRWLDEQIYLREQRLAALPALEAAPAATAPLDAANSPLEASSTAADPPTADTATRTSAADAPQAPTPSLPPAPTWTPVAAALVDAAKGKQWAPAPVVVDPQRTVDLNRLADELTDQRYLIVEAWARLAALHDEWHADCAQAAADLDALGYELSARAEVVHAREQAAVHADAALQQRHQELERLQHQMIAWRTRLRVEENSWESDKAKLIAELQGKETQVEQHLKTLVALRQRWNKRRKKEIEALHSERATLETFRIEIAKLRQELLKRAAALEDDKNVQAEKALALEQYRHDTLARHADDPQAERRVERLRRRWLTQNAEAIRNAVAEREALHTELRNLETRYETLQRRSVTVAAAESELCERQLAWEHEQSLTAAEQARLEHDLRRAHEERLAAEEQLVALREEIERIARSLFDQSDPPSLPLDRAA